MNEEEWLTCADPKPMLEFLRGKASVRKLGHAPDESQEKLDIEFLKWKALQRKPLLFAVACCRRIWHLLIDERSRCLVEKVELHADAIVTIFDVSNASDIHEDARATYDFKAPWWAAMYLASSFHGLHCQRTAWEAADAVGCATWWGSIPEDDPIIRLVESAGRDAEAEAQCRILRDIFGNPFRPVTIHPARLTLAVVALAQAIYDDRAFDRLPALADVLHDAGCDNDEILSHCRGPGPHVKGCWVVDLLLGKE